MQAHVGETLQAEDVALPLSQYILSLVEVDSRVHGPGGRADTPEVGSQIEGVDVLVVLLGFLGALRAQEKPEAAAERFEILLADFSDAIQSAFRDSTVDEVTVLEAETIAGVAGELLEEGESGIAADLLAEALALLDPSLLPERSSPPDSLPD